MVIFFNCWNKDFLQYKEKFIKMRTNLMNKRKQSKTTYKVIKEKSEYCDTLKNK